MTTTQTQSQTNGAVQTDRAYADFNIDAEANAYIVTLDGEWIGTFASEYGAKLHVACISR